MLHIDDGGNIMDNGDTVQKNFLTSKENADSTRSLLVNNKKETGNAYVKHEDRLFMKDPINMIQTKDVTPGMTLKTYANSVLHKGPSVESVTS